MLSQQQTQALEWVLYEAVDLSAARLPDLQPDTAKAEFDGLMSLIDLYATSPFANGDTDYMRNTLRRAMADCATP